MAKKVTVHYRRAVGRALADLDFRSCFEAGLSGVIDGVALRDSDAVRITTTSDGQRMCLLSPFADDNYCFGEVAVFREGDVPIAETDDDGNVHLRTITLGGNEEAVRGTTYFMTRGPHVAILHQESSTRFLEDYFRWLFRNPIGGLAQDEMVNLQPLIDAGGQPVALREVKALKIRAEVEAPHVAAPDERQVGAEHVRSFRRMIDRHHLSQANVRTILHALGLTSGSLNAFQNADFEDLEFELLVRKKENNRISALPDSLIQGIVNDGLDRAAEFQVPGAKRRGDVVVASYAGQVELEGAFYNLNSVRAVLWAALGSWVEQGLI